jgi:hypothetical protein
MSTSAAGPPPRHARRCGGAALRRRLGPGLDRPVEARHRTRTFVLTPAVTRLRADNDALVAGALARSRRGSALTRGVRKLLGAAACSSSRHATGWPYAKRRSRGRSRSDWPS